MSRKVQQAAAFAAATMMFFTVSGALAQDPLKGAETGNTDAVPAAEGAGSPMSGDDLKFIAQPIVQPLPEEETADDDAAVQAGAVKASSLRDLVALIPTSQHLSKDMRCLAGAIYFESRGEPLLGQLAVGRVIVNRAASGRFPSSYCGVVYQRSQFSFVRRGSMPSIDTSSRAWKNAKAIAMIAHESLWDSPAKGALFFHAASIKPGWRLTRVGRVNSHVFYR